MGFLVLEGLTKSFGDQVAVDGVDLAVEKGEFVSLLGPSGCGKTTTLQMIAGFVEPTAGTITLAGQDLGRLPAAKRGLGIVFQSYALFPHMDVAANVAFGLEMKGVDRAERKKRVAAILDLVGLTRYAARYPIALSGGQQQRVALARALVIEPKMLLLDEPLSNLDAKLREEMQLELRRIQRQLGTTTLLVTHDQSEAMALSDRVVVMRGGKVEQVARPVDAYESPGSQFVATFFGKANILGRAAIRPEKIGFAPMGSMGMPGKIGSRVFLGSQWLFEVDTHQGRVVVVRQNDGTPLPEEGSEIVLTWAADDLRALPDMVEA